jgi:exodeoxyribonuclease VII small subunit
MVAPDDQPATGLESLTFEDAFRQLSEMAEQLEAGGLSLADATARFEEGMKLVERCNTLLNSAELRITQLKDSYRGGVSLAQLEEELEAEE